VDHTTNMSKFEFPTKIAIAPTTAIAYALSGGGRFAAVRLV
jgi:hypothetical protein